MTAPMTYDQPIVSLDVLVRDEGAFRAWYDAALPRVYRYLVARTGGDTSLAEELTQQTFVEAIRRRRTFDGRSDVVTWLCAIGRNRLVDHYRRHGRETRRQDRLIEAHRLEGEPASERQGAGEEVERALAVLAPDHRLALILRYLDDLPVRDVARAIGRSEKATESLLVRARDNFRRAYGGRSDA